MKGERRSEPIRRVNGATFLFLGYSSNPLRQREFATPAQFRLVSERVSFRTSDAVTIVARWIPAEQSPCGTVILAHGIATNSSAMLRRAAWVHDIGYNALAVDFRAHGCSDGRFPSLGHQEANDLRAAVGWAQQHGATEPIILFGFSSGAVATLHAAITDGVSGVIADAPIAGHREMLERAIGQALCDPTVGRGTRLWLKFVQLPGVTQMAKLAYHLITGVKISPDVVDARVAVRQIRNLPILFIARAQDEIAVPSDVRALYDATPSRDKTLVVLDNCTHETFGQSTEQYREAVVRFLSAQSRRDGDSITKVRRLTRDTQVPVSLASL